MFFRAIDYDYAIVVLSQEVTFSSSVTPICLPEPSMNYDDTLAIVTGWGSLQSGGSQPDELYEVSVKTMNNTACSTSPSMYTPAMITDQMICAADPGKDSCQGDSGGPMITLETGSTDNYYSLIGVVSWGFGCALENAPGVYARVTAVLDWIQVNMKGSICQVP